MAVGKVLSVLVVLSVAATGAAWARDISSGMESGKSNTVKAMSADKAAKGGQAPASVRHTNPPAPIVMGRSVSDRRKTKLHHVKIKPLDSADTTGSASGSR